MDLLSINLKNCYGITSLDHSFEFTKSRAGGELSIRRFRRLELGSDSRRCAG